MSFFEELKRRNVIRVGIAYVVIAWVIAQVAELALDSFEAPGWVIKTILLVLALGFPLALFFAWAFELTPEGIKKEKDVDRSQSITAKTGRKLNVIIIGLMGIALTYFVAEKFVLAPDTASTPAAEQAPADDAPLAASIAVLPFTDLSPDGDQGYFSDGISEEILNVLVRVDGLSVASRTSSFGFKGQEALGIPAIAEKLKVRHVLEGSVRKAGDNIRVTAQLIDASTDQHVWSDTFNRTLTTENIFNIQDEISSQIVDALRAQLGVELSAARSIPVSTENLNAYELYLQAWRLFQARSQLPRAEQLLANATQLDPQYARAWEVRAAVNALRYDYGDVSMTRAELNQRALDFAQKAIDLDQNSALAFGVRAFVQAVSNSYLIAQTSVADVFADYDRALAIDNKSQSILMWRGIQHRMVGQLKEALADFDACIAIDSAYRPCRANRYITLHGLGRAEEAFESYNVTLLEGSSFLGSFEFGLLAMMSEKTAFTILTNSAHLLAGWDRHGELYDAYHDLDADHSELVNAARKFMEDKPTVDRIYAVPSLLIPIGAYDLIANTAMFWGYEYKNYRQSPQFKNYMKQAGVLEYWQQAGFPPQCQAVGQDDFRCD